MDFIKRSFIAVCYVIIAELYFPKGHSIAANYKMFWRGEYVKWMTQLRDHSYFFFIFNVNLLLDFDFVSMTPVPVASFE